MKKHLYIIIVFLFQTAYSQVTFVVDEFPDNTKESIYISGDFENWSGGNESYKLEKEGKAFYITFPKQDDNINFKFTQGSWDSVERDAKGNQIENRIYNFEKENDTVHIKILSWDKSEADQSTMADNVFILSEDFEIPQLNRKRKIWMYLPPNYNSANQSFPVIYMHDGQNLFDKSTSSYGEEWSVDETLNKLYKDNNMSFIVVGVDNGEDKRLDEYSPWTHPEYGGGEGEAYMEFIVQTLKPYIDSNYKTLTNKENTGIIGSSMGGLISHYAALKYPNVFGKVGVFSSAFWFASEDVNAFTKANGSIQDTKMYFLAGGKEGGNVKFEEISQTVTDMNAMISLLKDTGFSSQNMQSKIVPEGKHNEELWRNNFEEAMLWLFPEKIKKREFISVNRKENTLEVLVSDGTYLLQFYNTEIVETTFIPKGETLQPESHAVVLKPMSVSPEFMDTDAMTLFKTSGITVKIQKKPFQITYWYNDKEIISERNGYQKNDKFETLQFNLTKDEVLYGGGARALGMNRRGHRLELYNKAHYGYETESKLMNFTLPIVMSSNKYMVHFDNAPIGFLDLDSKGDNTLTYETISGRKTYQIVVGESWYDMIDNYTDLTGKQPMLPRWALGNFSSRFGYHSQKETIETIDKFREEEIPVDAIILDLYWFGKKLKGTMGNLSFDRDSFPNPQQMIKDLHSKNVETILITEPFILTTSSRWQEAVDEDILAKDSLGNPFKYDFYFGNTGLIDIYNPKGEQWFKNIYKDLSQLGVNGFWGDLGEPEVHPSDLIHATGTADEVHNIYGHDWARLVYEASLEANPNRRPFILMRAGYSGSQRFGMVPWSGDVNRTWGGLQSQPEIALQMGMQGLAYMHSDLGGFAGANLDDELYVRWLQYGVFQPIFRPHAQEEVASEPVFRSDKAKALAKQAIELRYSLLPYNYNLMATNHIEGKPLMRPLFFEDNSEILKDDATTYLWGNDFLVAPVTISKVEKKTVYFPKTSNWFDFYSDKKYKAGSVTIYDLKENSIPTFVRGGAFIPMTKSIQSTREYDGNTLELHYYFDKSVTESKQEFYNDNGKTVDAIQKDQYEILEFKAAIEKDWLNINFEAETGSNYSISDKEIELVIHNVLEKPKHIKVNNIKVKSIWKSEANTLTIPIKWNTSEEKEIKIKLKK
ncbi:TIM-barrel domain-containing protein [Psychroserpens ponticola]|uniref:Alpha/beta hydrolase-fold protein n=1 Tax=Psychroserpens ponticola TaxID=2932268 RepID=A0ABY7RWN8_9FLAO|nr:TIM-barrel domain-containing protein [Psychroserpens ponticola]WCO01258.1 alpha/beta hydrolase-fold protein [Psychroserpens ponticola]